MPEKSANSVPTHPWIFPLNPMIHCSFKALTFAVFLGILIVWGIDGWSANSSPKDYVIFKPKNLTQTLEKFTPYIATIHPNLINLTHTHQNQTQIQKNFPLDSTFPSNLTQNDPNVSNFSPQNSLNPTPSPTHLDWISAELEPNYTSNLLSGWLAPWGVPCRESRTVDISIPSLDGHSQIELATGEIHEFLFHALDESGNGHCLGGDYFEIDISGERWKSRPPIKDLKNGTYSLSVQIHPDFAGDYNLTIILLFRHYEGLKFSTQRFVFDKQVRKIPIKFVKSLVKLRELGPCNKKDFAREVWSGRWTRHGNNESCEIDHEGRFRCLASDFPCETPWCHGPLGSLESNGWTYSTHCSFILFPSEDAWKCLKGRWIFLWGDSNHPDTIRNILNFVLDVRETRLVPRSFDLNVTNPRNPSEVVRFTNIFNGHENVTGNYHGLYSLEDDGYREMLKGFFSGEIVPDTVVINSGLHDGIFWRNLRRFAEGAERAAAFWAEVAAAMRERGVVVPAFVYRSTVATGGYARQLAFNPSKMEAFNGVLLEKLRRFGVADWVVDNFDMTYPWHYDNRCNDGVHYGRAPAKARWRDGQIGHQYFVDVMLGHVLLNLLCAS